MTTGSEQNRHVIPHGDLDNRLQRRIADRPEIRLHLRIRRGRDRRPDKCRFEPVKTRRQLADPLRLLPVGQFVPPSALPFNQRRSVRREHDTHRQPGALSDRPDLKREMPAQKQHVLLLVPDGTLHFQNLALDAVQRRLYSAICRCSFSFSGCRLTVRASVRDSLRHS